MKRAFETGVEFFLFKPVERKKLLKRLASALADVDEEELVADFKELRRRGKGASR